MACGVTPRRSPRSVVPQPIAASARSLRTVPVGSTANGTSAAACSATAVSSSALRCRTVLPLSPAHRPALSGGCGGPDAVVVRGGHGECVEETQLLHWASPADTFRCFDLLRERAVGAV